MKRSVCVLGLVLALATPASAQQSVVARIRGEYPTPLGAAHGKFLVEVACQTGKGLLKKDWGTFVRLPDGTGVSQDIVMDRTGLHWDILGDGEGAAVPSWNLVTEPPAVDPARYYAPVCNTPPTPTTPPPPLLTDALLRDILEGLALLKADLKAARAELAEIKAKPVPCVSGRIGGTVPVTLCPK